MRSAILIEGSRAEYSAATIALQCSLMALWIIGIRARGYQKRQQCYCRICDTYNNTHVCHILLIREEAIVDCCCMRETRSGSIHKSGPCACTSGIGFGKRVLNQQVAMDIIYCILEDSAHEDLLVVEAKFGSPITKDDVSFGQPLWHHSSGRSVSNTVAVLR